MTKPETGPQNTATPLGNSIAENAGLIVHILLVAMPLGALVGVGVAAYDWVVNEPFTPRGTARPQHDNTARTPCAAPPPG